MSGPNQPPAHRRGTMSRRAMEHIRAQILDGHYSAGDVIRPETVGPEIGISPTPAREALQSLTTEGFLSLIPGKGFTVDPLTPQDIEDVFTAQQLIAGELAARAAQRATPQDVDELEAIHFEINAAAVRRLVDVVEERNHAFHRHITLLADAPKLARILAIVTHYVPRSFYGSIEGWPKASAEDHARIIAAFRSNDADAARVAMAEHVAHAGELLAQHIAAQK